MNDGYRPSDGSWSEPGCFEVAPGVHRVALSMPNDGLRAINVYVLETRDGLALIDGGWRVGTALPELESALALIGRRPDEIQDVYVTHVHRDHYTFGVELRRRFGSRLHLGRPEAPGLDDILVVASNVPHSSLRELRRSGAADLAARVERVTRDEPFELGDWARPDEWLDPGSLRVGKRVLDVVATPGHTKGHVVFHDLDAGLLFSGDHVLPTITPSIGFELGAWELPLGNYLASLRLLLTRPDARLLPAHGFPTPSVHARVLELLEHHDVRFEQTRRAVTSLAGPATALQVAELLSWTRRDRAFTELDEFNQMIATCETIAHLDVLVDRGDLAVDTVSGVDRFV